MKKLITFLAFFLLLQFSYGQANFTVGYGADLAFQDQLPEAIDIDLVTNSNGCSSASYGSGDLTLGARVNANFSTVASTVDFALKRNALNGLAIVDAIVDPTLGCSFDIFNYKGNIKMASFTSAFGFPLIFDVNNEFSYTESIQIYSPYNQPTTVELPLSISALLNAVSFFCISDDAAFARVSLTASLGGTSLTIADSTSAGDSWVPSLPSQSTSIKYTLTPGMNTLNLSVSGEAYVKIEVFGPSPLSTIVCSASTVAGVNSIRVGNFRGENGAPLPSGITIHGMDSGVNYSNPGVPIECPGIFPPIIEIVNDDCNQGLGSATITNVIDTLTYQWSNGISDTTITGLISGDYFCSVSGPSGCAIYVPVVVTDPSQPNIVLSPLIGKNDGEQISIAATDGSDPSWIYNWSTGENTNAIEVIDPGNYTVTITTSNGCEYIVTTEIYLLEHCYDFADQVLDYLPGCTGMSFDDPLQMLGENNFSGNVNDGSYVSLGDDGIIYAGFCENLMVNSGTPAHDLAIIEIGPSSEATRVEIRPFDDITENYLIQTGLDDSDGDGYYFLQNASGGTVNIDIDNIISGYERAVLKFNAIKLTDISPGNCAGNTPGADIDAVSYLSAQCIGDSTDYCSGLSCDFQIGEEMIECFDDGSYLVHIPIIGTLNNTEYTVLDQADFFNEIDTIQFIDDGSMDTITMGPYLFGRDYQIEIDGGTGLENCNFIVADTATCVFNQPCNLSVDFMTECVNDTLVITGTINNGIAPYSISSELNSDFINPDEGNEFSLKIPGCSHENYEIFITDWAMCQQTEMFTVTNIDDLNREPSCVDNVSIFPNPASIKLNLVLDNLCKDLVIDIYDSLGRKVMTKFAENISEAQLNIESLSEGIYFIHFDNGKSTRVERFVKF